MEILKSMEVPLERVDARRNTRDPEMAGLLRGFLTPETPDNPVDVARRFLNANGAERGAVFTKTLSLTARPGPEELVLDRQVQTPAGYHVRFQQYYAGLPVVGAGASVHMTDRRQIHLATNDTARNVPTLDVEAAKAGGVPREEAIRKALVAVDGVERVRGQSADAVMYSWEGRWYVAWKVVLSLGAVEPITSEADRASTWLVFVDLRSGDVLSRINILARATGQGKVFYPNPVVALRDTQLAPNTRFPEYAYRTVKLPRLRAGGYLSGKYVDTRLTPDPRAFSPTRQFLFDSRDPRFEEVMAYYWVDRACDTLNRFGFKGLFQEPLLVNARGTEDDQSWYDPGTRELNFGTGGINDAEDADIILHEFGHALLDALVPGWGNAWYDAPVRAMGEGVGDFLACVMVADLDGRFHPEVVGDWDAIAYSQDDPPALRRMDGAKTLRNVVGRGTSTALTANTLTDAQATWEPGALVGLALTPNAHAQGHPSYYAITENTAQTITVEAPAWDPLTAHAQVGDPYAGEEHQDGEFWAAVLWDIYRALGGDAPRESVRLKAGRDALKLVLTAHKYLDDQARESLQFSDASEALLDADRFVWGEPQDPGPHQALLEATLDKRCCR